MSARRAAALLLLLAGSWAAPAAARAAAPSAAVDVVRSGARWTADFRFSRAAPAWAFARSPLGRESKRSWRLESWTVETPGVRLERHGWFDVLVGEGGRPVPRRVRVRFTPYSKDIETDYDPALIFTDGSVALFDQQFKAFPLHTAEEAARMPIDPAGHANVHAPTRVTFRDAAGRVLHGGRRQRSVSLDDAGTYVLFGPAQTKVTPAMATIIDPALPGCLRAFLLDSTPKLLGDYARMLGPAPGTKPTVMVSWGGAETTKGYNMGGSVLPGLVVMSIDGANVLAENAAMRNAARWFIAHESAHFWLGQAVAYESARDAWITEGGADLLAVRTVAATDPGYDARAELQRSVDDCAKLSAGRGIATAIERNEHRAYYACGAVFALIAEKASKKSFAEWLRPLIDANREEGVLSRAEWLAALDASSRDTTLSRDIAALIDRGAADPNQALASLFARAGVRHEIAADGSLRLS